MLLVAGMMGWGVYHLSTMSSQLHRSGGCLTHFHTAVWIHYYYKCVYFSERVRWRQWEGGSKRLFHGPSAIDHSTHLVDLSHNCGEREDASACHILEALLAAVAELAVRPKRQNISGPLCMKPDQELKCRKKQLPAARLCFC